MTNERETAILEIIRTYACDRVSAEEILDGLAVEKRAAYQRALDERPTKIAAATVAYNAEIAKGGRNAEKRAVRAARHVWPSFVAPRREAQGQ